VRRCLVSNAADSATLRDSHACTHLADSWHHSKRTVFFCAGADESYEDNAVTELREEMGISEVSLRHNFNSTLRRRVCACGARFSRPHMTAT